jgi:uncharacterized membrane protein
MTQPWKYKMNSFSSFERITQIQFTRDTHSIMLFYQKKTSSVTTQLEKENKGNGVSTFLGSVRKVKKNYLYIYLYLYLYLYIKIEYLIFM